MSYLGHILSCDLYVKEDIISVKKNMCRKANCMLHTLPCCDPLTMTKQFQSFSVTQVFFCMTLLCGSHLPLNSTSLKLLTVTSYGRPGLSCITTTPESPFRCWLAKRIQY